ncbi:hypothetical protein COLO4_08547 [Corchorus olitorius]|uniref:Kinesin motor domain-containing protein n=1 Tax=Corchorus olitorius TaxID=93759 RepID=A0A1R3KFE2_9ROSI|nr:hypothetical protein COLO4_08547 [Corchorus olitorius]
MVGTKHDPGLKYRNQVMRGKLALVDLAGSERASETNSGGQKLRDGANINRSLLALANYINALVYDALVRTEQRINPANERAIE